ncbi:MAG: ABC transporter ATP-binding protein [Fidelibacterota bacterium]
MILKGEHLRKSYPTGEGRLTVLKDVTLSVKTGELLSVMGPSGSGKSTLLNVLGTLDRPDSGRLWIDGHDVLSLDDIHLSQLRNKTVGFVFQFHHLLPEFTVLENLMIPQMMNGVNPSDARRRGMSLLTRVTLGERKDHKPGTISGGERQRVAVLRALVNEPRLVLADEPTGNLDPENGAVLMAMIRELAEGGKQSFLIATHNASVGDQCGRSLRLVDGMIEENGKKYVDSAPTRG